VACIRGKKIIGSAGIMAKASTMKNSEASEIAMSSASKADGERSLLAAGTIRAVSITTMTTN
jgi:hypothetical protein